MKTHNSDIVVNQIGIRGIAKNLPHPFRSVFILIKVSRFYLRNFREIFPMDIPVGILENYLKNFISLKIIVLTFRCGGICGEACRH